MLTQGQLNQGGKQYAKNNKGREKDVCQTVAGCFHELVESIKGNIPQKDYFDDGFKDWLRKVCHMRITWNDGLVIMVEYSR